MEKLIGIFMAGALAVASGAWASIEGPMPDAERKGGSVASLPDSEQLEQGLQSLSWPQFKAVVQAIPKLKADVDAYGPLGWQYVQANYKTYHWRKNINKLHPDQKLHLDNLIREARQGAAGLTP